MALSDDLRARTADLHRLAERTGVIGDLLRAAATRDAYALLMRNLLPAYRALEAGLAAHGRLPVLAPLSCASVFRARRLEADLAAIAGGGFEQALPLLGEGAAYAARVAEVAARAPVLLAAHAYTRYLGDLSGGRVLEGQLRSRLGLTPEMLGFYRFPGIADVEAFKDAYRAALDACGEASGAGPALVEEARAAFRHNIAVSRAAGDAAGRAHPSRSSSMSAP